jgi:hypothetical protein
LILTWRDRLLDRYDPSTTIFSNSQSDISTNSVSLYSLYLTAGRCMQEIWKEKTELQVSSHRLERPTKMPSLMLRPVSDRRIGKNFADRLVKA